jgi:uncharacterized protein with NAD-binding domain and iron-sulfur cluster
MTPRVLVLGGGVAGMSAAHELAERDFEVVVLESRPIAEGKARSMPVPGSGTAGRRDLPGEHGFRFFPGFYCHLPDTMRRIPFEGERDGVVAAKAREMSARTGGYILLQLLFDLSRPGGQADRVLNGPTNDVWIDPWLAHLRSLRVDYRSEQQVQAIHCSGGQITGVGVIAGGHAYEVSADLYVAALPVEVMRLLVSDELKQAEPRLAGLHRLRTRWMNGIMFYLDRDVPLVHGHTVYIDSPWALTSISQAQFWPAVELEEMGDGRVDGILSIDVSDWEAPGIVHGKQAMYCSKEEVREEVWAQLEAGLEDAGMDTLDEANVRAWFLDPAIVYPNPTDAMNLEPLLINTAGSWEDRPDAVTSVDNLFLASDYVRGHTDLATMEGANEAARRAVNGILERTGSTQPRCPVWKLTEPAIFAPARALDRALFALRRPPAQQFRVVDGRIEAGAVASLGASVVERASRLRG